LVLVGAIFFLLGRKEFGEKHQKNVMYAVYIFLINIVFSIIFTVVISFITFTSISTSTSGIDTSSYPLYFVLQIIISAILGGLIIYFALIELEDDLGKKILFTGIISSICVSIITSIYYMGIFGELFGSISSTGSSSYSTFNQSIGGIGLLSVIPSILYIFALYIPFKRIKEGELAPQMLPQQNYPTSGRICPICGRPIPFDAVICPYCGKNFQH